MLFCKAAETYRYRFAASSKELKENNEQKLEMIYAGKAKKFSAR
jgi:hypothetical protein